MLTVIIGSNCQKGSILEKFVAEEQCIFKSDQHFTDQAWIPQKVGSRTESGDRV